MRGHLFTIAIVETSAMKKPKSMFKTNVIYGLIVLIPLTITVLILAKIVEILDTLAVAVGLQSVTSVGIAIVLALMLLLLLCFAIGAFVRTRIGSWSHEKLENAVLKQIPGYQIISNILQGFVEKKSAYPAAMVKLYGPGTAVLGFVMEESESGSVTVFVPTAPAITVGNIHIVDRERVTRLDAGAAGVAECISQWGIGAQKILDSKES